MENNPYFGLSELFMEARTGVAVPDVWENDSLHLEKLFSPLPPCLGARPRSAPSVPSTGRHMPSPTAAAVRAERIRRLQNAQPSWQIPQWDRQGYENRLRESLMQMARPPPNLSSIERSCVSRRLNSRKPPTITQNESPFRCSTASALPRQQVHLHLQYDPRNVRLELAIELSHLLAIAILFLIFLRSFF